MLRRHKILLEILEAGRPCSSADAPSMDGRTSRTSPPPAPRSRPSAPAPTQSSGAMADGQLAAPRPARGGQDYPAKPCIRIEQEKPSRSMADPLPLRKLRGKGSAISLICVRSVPDGRQLPRSPEASIRQPSAIGHLRLLPKIQPFRMRAAVLLSQLAGAPRPPRQLPSSNRLRLFRAYQSYNK